MACSPPTPRTPKARRAEAQAARSCAEIEMANLLENYLPTAVKDKHTGMARPREPARRPGAARAGGVPCSRWPEARPDIRTARHEQATKADLEYLSTWSAGHEHLEEHDDALNAGIAPCSTQVDPPSSAAPCARRVRAAPPA